MLYLYGETPLVNSGPWSILLNLYYHLLQALFTFRKYYFISLQANISFHTIRLILCFQQTGEIDNLTVSWGKVVGCVVCRFHVAAGAEAPARHQLFSGTLPKVS
jgi:hypothetical protein